MGSAPRYLLIIGCSQRKRPDPGLLPAIERYDGVNFRVLRKARRERYWPENLDVLILSAKYGLLEPETEIEDYDLKMTRQRAIELQPLIAPELVGRVEAASYAEIFVNLGKNYLSALAGWEESLEQDTTVVYASGGIGQRAAQMHQWLIELSRGDQ